MQHGIVLTTGDARTSVELAIEAESAGWDGVFTWDAIAIDTMDILDLDRGELTSWPGSYASYERRRREADGLLELPDGHQAPHVTRRLGGAGGGARPTEDL